RGAAHEVALLGGIAMTAHEPQRDAQDDEGGERAAHDHEEVASLLALVERVQVVHLVHEATHVAQGPLLELPLGVILRWLGHGQSVCAPMRSRSYTEYCSSSAEPSALRVRFTVIQTSGASVSHTSLVWRISSPATLRAASHDGAFHARTRCQASASAWASASASVTSTTSAMEQRAREPIARKDEPQWQAGSHAGAVSKSQT